MVCRRCCEPARFGLLTDTPLARERFSLLEIYELNCWFEPGLTDHDIAQRVELPYRRVHRLFLKLRRAIHAFEDAATRVLDGEVEVDETYFGASFENRRAGKRAKLRKAGKVKRGRVQRTFGTSSSASTSGPTASSTSIWWPTPRARN